VIDLIFAEYMYQANKVTKMFTINKVIIDNRTEYHIIRPNGSLVDIELDYGRAWVRMLVYENIDK
jgi:hypothetical protein